MNKEEDIYNNFNSISLVNSITKNSSITSSIINNKLPVDSDSNLKSEDIPDGEQLFNHNSHNYENNYYKHKLSKSEDQCNKLVENMSSIANGLDEEVFDYENKEHFNRQKKVSSSNYKYSSGSDKSSDIDLISFTDDNESISKRKDNEQHFKNYDLDGKFGIFSLELLINLILNIV